jgi:hypothetical protein
MAQLKAAVLDKPAALIHMGMAPSNIPKPIPAACAAGLHVTQGRATQHSAAC